MSQLSIPQALQLAIEHHAAGRLREAEPIYRQILAVQPQNADALHLLGVLACATENYLPAIDLIRQAIALNPANPNYHSNLGETLRRAGKYEEAVEASRKALSLDPTAPGPHNNLAIALQNLNRNEESIVACQKAIDLQPAFPEAWLNLANGLAKLGRDEEAITCFKSAIKLNPTNGGPLNNLGVVYLKLHRDDEAQAAFQEAVRINPNDSEALINLGNFYNDRKRTPDALRLFEAAIRADPKRAEAHSGRASILKTIERPDDAILAYRQALAIRENAYDRANLGLCLRDRGQPAEAVVELRKALEVDPTVAAVHSAIIVTMLLQPEATPEMLLAEQRLWNQHYAQPLAAARLPHENDRTPDRPLRVGYVSPDFRDHPVGRFMLPLLAAHDPAKVTVVSYSAVLVPDEITNQIKASSAEWRAIVTLNEEQLAQQIRADKIDILIDLAMHTRNNHLLAFARKPAPVQVSYLAYAGGSGVETMDYRLTDAYIDPVSGIGVPAGVPAFEKPHRLPDTFWCYAPGIPTPDPNPLPALSAGHITFACLSHIAKIMPPALELWAQILNRVPGSRLILHIPPGWSRDRATAIFQKAGVDLSRLTFAGHLPIADYFKSYHEVDIALDPFPYAGGTTTCDSLWMGVPVVTLAGEMPASRGGLSLLSIMGLERVVARSSEEYLGIAAALASDLGVLAELRRGMRQRMLASPLTDAKRFVGNLEVAYRQMWQTWCGSKT